MTPKFREFYFKEHTRVSHYLKPGEFIQINDPDGFIAFMKIRYAEVMGMMPLLFADQYDGIPAKAPRVAGGAPFPPVESDANFVEMPFLSPNREDRLIQVRPVVFALYRFLQPLAILRGQLVAPTPTMRDVWVQWVHPVQTNRGGTDKDSDFILNLNSAGGGIPQNAGGKLGGVINCVDVYARDDPNEDFDLFVLNGTVPGFKILNNSSEFPIGGGATDNENLDFDWYLTFQGYRYVMEPVSEAELKALLNYDQKFTPVSVGGAPNISTIRAGGV